MPPISAHVIRDYTRSNPAPLSGMAGEIVTVTEETDLWDDNPAWCWIKCFDARGNSGWVAANYLTITGSQGVLKRTYSAQELTVQQGQPSTILDAESAWYWCRTVAGEEGWVPMTHITADSAI